MTNFALLSPIAVPLVWHTIHRWLDGYAYRIRVSFLELMADGVLIVLIATHHQFPRIESCNNEPCEKSEVRIN